MNNIKHLNNYSISEIILDNVLNWASESSKKESPQQICARIEKILDNVQDKEGHYKKGYDKGFLDGQDWDED